MNLHNIRLLFLSISSVLIVGCLASPPKLSSGILLPGSWSAPTELVDAPLVTEGTAAQVEHYWWRNFGDETLSSVIRDALSNNKTLKIALARTAEARAGRIAAQSLILPQIGADISVQRGNQGFATGDRTVKQLDLGLQASWEIDLFGGNQARIREAEAILESQEAAQHAILVGLLGEVARNYFDLRNWQQQLILTDRNIALQRKTFAIVKAQFAEKVVGELDVQRAGAQLASSEAELPTLRTALAASRNRLQVLLGIVPGSNWQELSAPHRFQPLSHRAVIAAPAAVIATRPDVIVAERRLAASIAAIDAATADLFPKIGLTTFFGAQTVSPESYMPWALGVKLIQPLLNFGRLQAQVDAKNAQQQQAFFAYQQTVLTALEEMENGLTAYINETSRNSSLTEAVQRNRIAEKLAEKQYEEGHTGLLDLLIAQQNLLATEASLTKSDTTLRNDLVAIYVAAGGGWEIEEFDKGSARQT